MPRSLWNGTLAFGMVRVPVKLYAATEAKQVRFRERHALDGAAIEHRRVCAQEGREVPYAEIVKGYEVEPGTYVALTNDEVAAADGPSPRTVAIEHFVDGTEIDSLHYGHAYYVGPGKGGAEPYRVLHAALARSGRVGIGRFTFHNKAQVVAVRALEDVLALETMRFADELISPRARGLVPERAQIGERELRAALLLIEQLGGGFEPAAYTDTYREQLMALIERKARGETIEPPAHVPATGGDDLLAALEASLARASGPEAPPRRRSREAHRTGRGTRGGGRGGATARGGERDGHGERERPRAQTRKRR